jgi:hypothetical protein
MNLNLSPQQLQAYELSWLWVSSWSAWISRLIYTSQHLPQSMPQSTPPVRPYLFLLPLYLSLNLILQLDLHHLHPPPLRQPSLRHHRTRIPHRIPALLILILCFHPTCAMAESLPQSFDIEAPPPADLTPMPHQLQIVHRLHASELPRRLLWPSPAPAIGTRHRSTLTRSAPTPKTHHLPLSDAEPTTAPGLMSLASAPVFRR